MVTPTKFPNTYSFRTLKIGIPASRNLLAIAIFALFSGVEPVAFAKELKMEQLLVLKEQARGGDGEAQRAVARHYERKGLPSMALEWWTMIAEQGDMEAQSRLARLYEKKPRLFARPIFTKRKRILRALLSGGRRRLNKAMPMPNMNWAVVTQPAKASLEI